MAVMEEKVEAFQDDDAPPAPPVGPKTATVIGLLVGAALTFSYLAAYCGVNALVAADVMSPLKPGHDPRFRLFAIFTVVFAGIFTGFGALARWASRRQLSSIDAMETDES
jgi:uncharacterized membrane protein YedE/YeeE